MEAKFAILENKDVWPMPLVLHLSAPLVIGQVVQCTSEEHLYQVQQQAFREGRAGAELRDYRILIISAGSLDGSLDHIDGDPQEAADRLAKIFREMADFYLDYRIFRSPNVYEKYRRER